MTNNNGAWNFQEKILSYDWDKAAREAEKNRRPGWARSLQHGFYGPLS